MNKIKPVLIALAAIAIIYTFADIFRKEDKDDSLPIPDVIHCALEIAQYDNHTNGLVTGYNYQLLKDFAEFYGKEVSIRLTNKEESILDSLINNQIDLVVLPYNKEENPQLTDIRYSIPADSLTLWTVNEKARELLQDINRWLAIYNGSPERDRLHRLYFTRLDPYKRKSNQDFISPYDPLVKECAARMGWDWRLLSAVIYQESHFEIDAKSNKGAQGIMQMTAPTAKRMQNYDLLDPETNIRAGSRYLWRLSKQYDSLPDPQERIKFALASYNAGPARIDTCVQYARQNGYDASSWDQIVTLLPEMDRFNGKETIKFVDNILSIYDEFVRICP